MNLKQMTAFREVMLTGSVSEAARNLNRTQPSISHMINTLEDELGMRLFERRRGRLHPVPEAQYLFEESDALLSRVGTIRQNMQRMKTMDSGALRIASMPGPTTVLLPDLICRHVGNRPDVTATLISRSSDAVLQLVGTQQFDIGIADHDPNRFVETSLISAQTFRFDSLCAVSVDDPLASRAFISPGDLHQRSMAALFPEHLSHRLLRDTFAAAGAALNVRFVGQFFQPLLTYVQRGLAAAIVDPLSARSWQMGCAQADEVVFRPLRPGIEFGVDLLTPAYRPASVLAASFTQRLRETFAELGGA